MHGNKYVAKSSFESQYDSQKSYCSLKHGVSIYVPRNECPNFNHDFKPIKSQMVIQKIDDSGEEIKINPNSNQPNN